MNTRFEEQYPLDAREKEIRQILNFVTRGQSCQLISVPGAGRSTVLRLLAYHKKLLTYHFKTMKSPPQRDPAIAGQSSNLLFTYVNFAEIPNFATPELNKFLFLSILSSIQDSYPRGAPQAQHHLGGGRMDSPEVNLYEELYSLFEETLRLADPLVLFQNLKKTIEQLNPSTSSGQAIVFLFDRFSEFAEKTGSDFFGNLRTLRMVSGGKLAVVFSTHRPLENLLPVSHWQDFYEFFVGHHIFLTMYDKVATGFRLSVLEKEYGKKFPPEIKEALVKLTGGHGKLMKLSAQLLLSESRVAKRFPRGESLIDFLLAHILIQGSLFEVWQSLTPEERSNPLFPLFTEFIKRGIPEVLVPKTIRLDPATNEVYFGDEPILGLTAYEFRLLSYLIKNPNRVCEREEIINAVWTESKTQAGVTDEALDQMVFRLRRKIEDEADNPKHLLTVKGRGFRFIP